MVTRQKIHSKYTTPLSEIFRGQLRIRSVKSSENEHTEILEPFFTLKLNIEVLILFIYKNVVFNFYLLLMQKAKSVQEALNMLITKDILKNLTSSKTDRELDAYQQVTIDELPYVLLLHLKCFEYKQQKLTKMVKNVEFPVDLEIEPSKYIFML